MVRRRWDQARGPADSQPPADAAHGYYQAAATRNHAPVRRDPAQLAGVLAVLALVCVVLGLLAG